MLRGRTEGDGVAQLLELLDEPELVALGIAAADNPVTAEVLVVAAAGEQVPGDDRIEWPTATAAFFLPMRRASRQNWAAR
jgi:hypothetical protein